MYGRVWLNVQSIVLYLTSPYRFYHENIVDRLDLGSVASYSKRERVCATCLMEQSHLESASEGDDSDTTGDSRSRDFEESVEIPAMRSSKWKHKGQLYLNAAEANVEPEGWCWVD